MTMPTAMFLDTSVFDGQQYNFNSSALTTLVQAAQGGEIKLLLPDPTEREVRRHISERSKEALRALARARRAAPFLSKWPHFPDFKEGRHAEWQVENLARSEWAEFLKQFDVDRLGYGGVSLPTVMSWYDRITPPFGTGKKRKEFPDAFAVAILQAYAQEHGAYIAVVAQDRDFKSTCDLYPSLLYFPSAPRLTEVLLAKPEETAALRSAIEGDLTALEQGVLGAAEDLSFYHSDDTYRLEHDYVIEARIEEINIVAVGDGECTVLFEAEVESRHELRWLEVVDPYEGYTAEVAAEVTNEAHLPGIAKVALEPETRRIKDITLLELDDEEIEVTESPGDGY